MGDKHKNPVREAYDVIRSVAELAAGGAVDVDDVGRLFSEIGDVGQSVAQYLADPEQAAIVDAASQEIKAIGRLIAATDNKNKMPDMMRAAGDLLEGAGAIVRAAADF